jgi:hypothetical protein
LLLPEAIDDYVGSDNPVRFIDAFVDGLDLAAASFSGVEPKATGRPSYAPADLLKLYIYGYLNRVRSSRRLEAETHRNIEMIWLLRPRAVSQSRQFSITIAFRVGDRPIALKAEPVEKSEGFGIMHTRPGRQKHLEHRARILRSEIFCGDGDPRRLIATSPPPSSAPRRRSRPASRPIASPKHQIPPFGRTPLRPVPLLSFLASRMPRSGHFRSCCHADSIRTLEMPRGLSLPLAFGINTRLIGSGR